MIDTELPSSERSGNRQKPNRRNILIGLTTALVIAAAAYWLAGSAGIGDLGAGGMNQDLLPKIGEEAPDFAAVSSDGRIVRLSDYRGQPVWLNFWGSWCAPCRSEMPDIQTAWETLQPQGLALLAVSLGDKPSEAIGFAQKNNVTFTILLDPDRSLTSDAYPIYNFPTHIFIDEQGIVREIVMSQMSSEQAIAAAQSVLAEPSAATRSGD